MIRRILFAAWLFAGLGVLDVRAASQAQTVALPAARDVIAAHITAIGGEAAFKALNSILVRGRFEMPDGNRILTGTLTIASSRPNKLLTKVDVPGVGLIETGFDGKVGWMIDPQSGPALMKGQQLLEIMDDARFEATLHGPDHVKDMTTIERTTFDKRPAIKVHVVFNSGREQDEYFDAEKGWQIGWEGRRETSLGIVPSSTVLRDYKKFGALMQPTTLVERAMGLEQVLRLVSCEFDAVPAATFDLPLAVKALIK